MKIDSEPLIEFFNNLKYMVSQITEAVKIGDDGYKDCIQNQEAEINTAINGFILLNLTQVTKKKVGLAYVKFWEENYNPDGLYKEMNSNENTLMYKAGLYNNIKKELSKLGDNLAAVPNNELYNWIETYTIFNGSKYERMVTSNEWYQASINVVNDIKIEIVTQRIKAPQQKMF